MPLPQFPFPSLVDSTMMSAFDSCEQKWCYEFGHKLSPLAISPDLHAGGAFSHGIAIARTGYYKYKLSQNDALIAGARGIMEFWGDFDPPEKNPKTCEAMVGALEDYLNTYPFETDLYQPLILSDGSAAVEYSFSIISDVLNPDTNEPVVFAGRFDMLANYDNQFLCIVDEKTTKAFYGDWDAIWGMRGQFMGYCYALQQNGYKVDIAVIRGIQILKTMYHQREVLEQYPQWQIDRWWETMNKKLRKMVECWKTNDWTLSFGDACGNYGGCVFIPLCISATPENQFSNYQRREWNPLEKDPTWPKGGPQYEIIANIKELM